MVIAAPSEAAETSTVAAFIREALAAGIAPSEIGIFTRGYEQAPRASAAVNAARCFEFLGDLAPR